MDATHLYGLNHWSTDRTPAGKIVTTGWAHKVIGSEDEKDLQTPSTEPSSPVRRRAIAQRVSGLPFGRGTVPTVQAPSAAIMPSPAGGSLVSGTGESL